MQLAQDSLISKRPHWSDATYDRLKLHMMEIQKGDGKVEMVSAIKNHVCFRCHKTEGEILTCVGGEVCNVSNALKVDYES